MVKKRGDAKNTAGEIVAPKTAEVRRRMSIITSFTPTIMDAETLREIFVAREPLVKRIVRDIREGTTSRARRHTLLIGPRGIGKTHLVSMVYYAVKEDAALYDRLRIAWLREEEWSVFSYADLLVRIFRALANEYPVERGDLNDFADKLMRHPVDEGEKIGEEKLLAFLGERLLLLVAENINDLFENMGVKGQQSLRAFLQNHSRAVLLVASPALTDDLSDHDAPFYGFFNTTHLKEFTRAEARELLHKIASREGDDTELAEYLETEEADRRLRVIEALAGGHPRIWVLFSGCMTKRLLDELVPLFVKMLDDLTPYYQERMRSLPPQERRIVSFLCERRGAVTVREIAEALRLKPNAAAALLGKLDDKAYVRKAPEPTIASTGDRRVTYYEMREPLMRLCIEVKENRAEPLGLIVEFLRLWYREDELWERLGTLPANALLTRRYTEAALERLSEVRGESRRLIVDGYSKWENQQWEEALATFQQAATLNPNDSTAWLGCAMTLHDLKRNVEALESLKQVVMLEPNLAIGWNLCGIIQSELNNYSESLQCFDRAIALDSDAIPATTWTVYAMTSAHLQRYQQALESLDYAIHLNPELANVDYFVRRSGILVRLGRFPDALESVERAMSLGHLDEATFAVRTISLLMLGRTDEAKMAMEKMTPVFAEDITDAGAEAWLAVWEKAGRDRPEMDVALRLLRAAVEWKRTRDRGALLRLASEEREVLETLLADANMKAME